MSRARALLTYDKLGKSGALTGRDPYAHGPNYVPSPNTLEAKRELRLRQPLDNARRNQVITLPDGRKLGYAIYGSMSKNAKVAIYNHGIPGTRKEAAMLHTICIQKFIKLVAIDRPGLGLSSSPRWWNWTNGGFGRSIKSWANDVHYLLDNAPGLFPALTHAALKQYYLIGVSGGGPYALACALNPPSTHRILGVALISAATPFDKDPTYPNSKRTAQKVLSSIPSAITGPAIDMFVGRQARKSEDTLRQLMDVTYVSMDDEQSGRQLFWSKDTPRPGTAKPIVSARMAAVYNAQEITKVPYQHYIDEFKLVGHNSWGFTLEEVVKKVHAPIRIFHGSQDRTIHVDAVRKMKSLLPQATLAVFDAGTHSSILISPRSREVIMSDLLNFKRQNYQDGIRLVNAST